MSTLCDLYEKLDEDAEAENADYVMQALWRDLTTERDTVGPYYTSSGTFKANAALCNGCIEKISLSRIFYLCNHL